MKSDRYATTRLCVLCPFIKTEPFLKVCFSLSKWLIFKQYFSVILESQKLLLLFKAKTVSFLQFYNCFETIGHKNHQHFTVYIHGKTKQNFLQKYGGNSKYQSLLSPINFESLKNLNSNNSSSTFIFTIFERKSQFFHSVPQIVENILALFNLSEKVYLTAEK